jgi:hypothetical protein
MKQADFKNTEITKTIAWMTSKTQVFKLLNSENREKFIIPK